MVPPMNHALQGPTQPRRSPPAHRAEYIIFSVPVLLTRLVNAVTKTLVSPGAESTVAPHTRPLGPSFHRSIAMATTHE